MKKITQFFIKRNDNNKEIDTEKGNDGDSEKGVNDLDIVNVTDLLNKTLLSNMNTSITDDGCIPNHINNNKEESWEVKKYFDKPNQLILIIDFPKNEQKRKFQEKWYKEFLGLNTMFSLTQLFVLFVNNTR